MNQSRSGNAMIYVLVGIMLFAALAYTFMRSGQTAGSNISQHQAKLAAQEIIAFSNNMEKTINKLRTAGCSESELNFDNATVTGYDNTYAPSDESCDIFSSNGGKLTWTNPPAGSNDGSSYTYVGGPNIHTRNGQNSTYINSNADLVLYAFGLNAAVCRAINTSLNISDIPVDEGFIGSADKFVGNYLVQENITGLTAGSAPSPCIAAPGTGLCGKSAACFREQSGPARYVFYAIILSR